MPRLSIWHALSSFGTCKQVIVPRQYSAVLKLEGRFSLQDGGIFVSCDEQVIFIVFGSRYTRKPH